jgi:hypothetical protein
MTGFQSATELYRHDRRHYQSESSVLRLSIYFDHKPHARAINMAKLNFTGEEEAID